VLFTVVVACYDRMITSLTVPIAYMLHFGAPPLVSWQARGQPVFGALVEVLFAPLVESCILIGAIELLRWLRAPGWLQVLAAAGILAGPHSFRWGPEGILVMPSFTIQAASFLYWRARSWKKGFAVVAAIHALSNLMPAMWIVAHAHRLA
jgi:hypothetical protein